MANCPGIDMNFGGSNKINDTKTKEYWRSCAMQLATSSVLPMAILEIISKAGEGGASAEEIASQLELTNDATITTTTSMLDRMICLLASHSILTCSFSANDVKQLTEKRRMYGLGPLSVHFVPNSHGVSLGPLMLLVQDKVLMRSWDELKPALLEGGIQFKNPWCACILISGKGPKVLFNRAMINFTTTLVKEILDSYKGFEQSLRVVDIGGGLGVALKLVTTKYPHIKGINFDLPHVIQHASHYPGVEHIAGDMFVCVPRGDAIFMKSILHDWSDDHSLKLLKNCHRALPDNGKVIIVETIHPILPDTTPANKALCQLDLIVMTQNPSGKEQTEHEYLSLAKTAGFAGIRLECFVCNFCVMEFYKKNLLRVELIKLDATEESILFWNFALIIIVGLSYV